MGEGIRQCMDHDIVISVIHLNPEVMKRTSILFVLLLLAQLGGAQQMTWGTAIEGLPGTPSYASATPTPEGGVIVCGYFNLSGSDRPFLARFAADGNQEWVKVFETVSSFYMTDVALKKDGTIAVGGWAGYDSDIDPGPGVVIVPGSYNAYLASFSATGNLMTVDTFGDGRIMGLEVDEAGNLYLLGHTGADSYPWDMDLGPGKFLIVPDAEAASELVLAKYSPAGQLLWARQTTGMGVPGEISSLSTLFLRLDGKGSVYAAGLFNAPLANIAFPSMGNPVVLQGKKPSNLIDIYLAKFSAADGEAAWVRAVGGRKFHQLWGMDVGPDGQVVLAGGYPDSTLFDGAPDTVLAPWRPANGLDDLFFAIYDPSGTVTHLAGMPAGDSETFFGAAFSPAGEVWLAARIGMEPIDFDPGPGASIVDSFGIAMARYSPDAELDWVYPMAADRPLTLIPDPTGGFFLVSRGNGAVDYDVTPRVQMFGNSLARVAVVRYRDCDITWTEAQWALCAGESFLLGDTLVDGPGIYQGIVVSSDGCDSVVTLEVEDLIIDTLVLEVAGGLEAQSVAGTFQWIDCADGLPIPDADEALFLPTASGSYAVVVTVDGCSDTSSCREVTLSGIDDSGIGAGIRLWPVPAGDMLWLELPPSAPMPSEIRVIDTYGRVVRSIRSGMDRTMGISLERLPSGRYVVDLLYEDGIHRRAFVKG